jgi:hypothetical protein
MDSTKVYPKVSGLAAWSGNCKWYSSLPLGAVVFLFCESVSEFCCFSMSVYCCLFRYQLSLATFGHTVIHREFCNSFSRYMLHKKLYY